MHSIQNHSRATNSMSLSSAEPSKAITAWLTQTGLAGEARLTQTIQALRQAQATIRDNGGIQHDSSDIEVTRAAIGLKRATLQAFADYGYDFVPDIVIDFSEQTDGIYLDTLDWVIAIPVDLLKHPQLCSGLCALLRETEHLVFCARMLLDEPGTTHESVANSFAQAALQGNISNGAATSRLQLALPAQEAKAIRTLYRDLLGAYESYHLINTKRAPENHAMNLVRLPLALPPLLCADVANLAARADRM